MLLAAGPTMISYYLATMKVRKHSWKTMIQGRRNDAAGFTLIELLAAIGVAGLLMAIAMPIFTRTLPGLRLNDAARQIATDLQQVRMRAIAQSIPHQISFAMTTYIVQRCNGACANDGGNMVLPQGITITPPSTAPQFQPRGTVPLATTIRLSNGTTNKWVCVKIVGRINVQDTVCT
jgi:prepilin-type N-terminal cleavage/methylation domain-containing protein